MADATATCSLFRIEQLGMKANIAKHSFLLAYYKRMQQRASFKPAIQIQSAQLNQERK